MPRRPVCSATSRSSAANHDRTDRRAWRSDGTRRGESARHRLVRAARRRRPSPASTPTRSSTCPSLARTPTSSASTAGRSARPGRSTTPGPARPHRRARHTQHRVELSGDLAADTAQLADVVGDAARPAPVVPEDPYLLLAPNGAATSHHVAEARCRTPPRSSIASSPRQSASMRPWSACTPPGGPSPGSPGRSVSGTGTRPPASISTGVSICKPTCRASTATPASTGTTMRSPQPSHRARHELAVLARPAIVLDPGGYRTLLAPAAVAELFDLLSWGGFGTPGATRTRQTPLLRMIDGDDSFADGVQLTEDTAGGVAPHFNERRLRTPRPVELIIDGRYRRYPRLASIGAGVRHRHQRRLLVGGRPSPSPWRPATSPRDEALAALGHRVGRRQPLVHRTGRTTRRAASRE